MSSMCTVATLGRREESTLRIVANPTMGGGEHSAQQCPHTHVRRENTLRNSVPLS